MWEEAWYRAKGLACWALGSFPESAAERLQDLGTSDDLHGSYHLYVTWFPPSVHWGNACTFLILFSGSRIGVLELVAVWKKMRLRFLSFLGGFENCLLCLYSLSVNHCNLSAMQVPAVMILVLVGPWKRPSPWLYTCWKSAGQGPHRALCGVRPYPAL